MCIVLFNNIKQLHFGNLNILPTDVLLYLIKSFLNCNDIFNISKISVSFYLLSHNQNIWKHIYKQSSNSLPPSLCWKCSVISNNFKSSFIGHPNIHINDSIISNKCSAWNTFIINKSLTYGVYSISFTIIDSESIMFGITTKPIQTLISDYYHPGNGNPGITSTHNSVAYYDSYSWMNRLFQKNDVITMIVNTHNKTVLFIKNNALQSPSATWTDNNPVYIIISFCHTPNIVQFNSFLKLSYNYIYMNCPDCSQLFASKQALFYHTNIRKYKCTQQLSCETCFKSFTNRRNFLLHKCPKLITSDNNPTK